ncbi:hypothetical protein Tco_0608797, partial [Tanacetum coccineum]
IKKLLPTHIPKAVANYVMSRLNTSVLDVMKNNQINLFTQSFTSTDDLSQMDLKILLIIVRGRTRRKDVGEPSSRSSRRNKSLMIHAQVDTPTIQPLDQEDENKDELTIADLKGVGLETLKQQYKNDVELECHVGQLKAAVLIEAKWNSDEDDVTEEKYTTYITKHYAARYYKQGIEDMISYRWSKETHRYIFEALNVRRSDDKEYEFSYADLPRPSLNDVEDMYILQVQDKLHHLPLEFVKTLVDMMVDKIDKILKRKEQLRRLEEYVGRKPKTVNPLTFVRPM